MMNPHRQENRIQLHRYPHVFDEEGNLVGFLGNISRLGMMLLAYQAYAPESCPIFYIRLPAHLDFSCEPLRVTGQVRWQRVWGEKRDLWCHGIQFAGLSQEDLSLIEDIQLRLGFEIGYSPDVFVPE